MEKRIRKIISKRKEKETDMRKHRKETLKTKTNHHSKK